MNLDQKIVTLFFFRVPDFLFGVEAAAGDLGAGVLSLVAGTERLTRDIMWPKLNCHSVRLQKILVCH